MVGLHLGTPLYSYITVGVGMSLSHAVSQKLYTLQSIIEPLPPIRQKTYRPASLAIASYSSISRLILSTVEVIMTVKQANPPELAISTN